MDSQSPALTTTSSPTPDAQPKTLSPRKLASVRANARKSHGPTTPAGLAKCACAAASQIIHGMRAKSVVIAGESEARFIALLNAYVATHNPITEPEHEAVFQMAAAVWRQRRVLAFQTMDFNRHIALQAQQPTADPDVPKPYLATLAFLAACEDSSNGQAVAHRYETTYLRHYNRALKNLSDLKLLRNKSDGLDGDSLPAIGGNWEEPA